MSNGLEIGVRAPKALLYLTVPDHSLGCIWDLIPLPTDDTDPACVLTS